MKFPFFNRRKEEDATKPLSPPRKIKSKRQGRIVAQYDFSKVQNENGGHIRQAQRIEIGSEEDQQGGGLTLLNRFKGINAARDLMRNSAILQSHIQTLQNCVIGDGCDMMFYNSSDQWYRDAELAWRRWSKHASFRDGGNLVDLLDKILYTLLAEGDCVLLFDGEGTVQDSGKIIMFPPDQICPLSDFDSKFGERNWTQTDGIIKDEFGRIVGVSIAHKPGMMSVPSDDALILLKDDPYQIGDWTYIKRSFRDSTRGIADALPVLGDLQDAREIMAYEKISAKRFAAQYAYINEAPQEAAVTPEGFIEDDSSISDEETEEQEFQIEHLQDVTAGMLDLLPNGSSVTFSPNDRPSPRTLEFIDTVRETSGSVFGLSRSFALAKADTSYTAARFDSGLAEKSFKKLQQYVDDNILDWLAEKVIQWHIDHELLDPAPDENWIDSAAFHHPKTREVLDEVKEAQYQALVLKNGTQNLEGLVGPQWKSVLDQLAEEKRYAESQGLALSMGETANGTYIEQPETDLESETDEEN